MEAIIYLEIVEQIKTKIPGIKWIDLDTGQVDNMENENPIITPAVFIGFDRINWKTQGNWQQIGDCIINFRVVQKDFNDTYVGSINQEAAFDKLELLHKLHYVLMGFYGSCFNRLERTTTAQEPRNDGLTIFNIHYRCAVSDERTLWAGRGGKVENPEITLIKKPIHPDETE